MTPIADVPRCPACNSTRMAGKHCGPCITCAPNVSRGEQTRAAKVRQAADWAARGVSETRWARRPDARIGR